MQVLYNHILATLYASPSYIQLCSNKDSIYNVYLHDTRVCAHIGVRCPLGSIVYMVYSWATGRAVGEATKDVKIGTKMGINIYQWCRDMCSWKLINGPPIMLGGQGAIVQIDESVFTHQGKVTI